MEGQTAASAPATGPINDAAPAQQEGVQESKAKPTVEELFEINVAGKKSKVTREELIRKAQLGERSLEKFNEAAAKEKRIQALISKAKTSPIEALMDPDLGLTKEQIRNAVEDWYNKEFIEPETLSPAERKAKEMEARLKKYEQLEQEQLKKAQEEEQNQLTQKEMAYYQKKIIDTMEASGLPKTKVLASRIAFYMAQNESNGWDAPMEMLVEQVRDEYKQHQLDFGQNATAEQIISLLGEDVVNKIRKYDLEKLRARRAAGPAKGVSLTAPSEDRPSYADVEKNLRRLRTRGY